MVVLRSTVSEVTRKEGKTAAVVVVRASSKMGAIVAARIVSVQMMSLRSQKIVEVNRLSEGRVLDSWEVVVKDENKLDIIGK